MMGYLFRRPRFPLICIIDELLLSARSGSELESKLKSLSSGADSSYDVIDGSGEGWSLVTEEMVVSPFTLKKRWTKKEIIRLYNESQCSQITGKQYSEKSLSAKRLDRIIKDIAKLISDANKTMQRTSPAEY